MPSAKDPKSLLWEHQLKRQHKLLSERLDQMENSTAESQAAMERRILERRQATEAAVKNLEAKLITVGDQIRTMQEGRAVVNNEQQRLTRELRESLDDLTRKIETLQASNTATEETLQQAVVGEKRCALLIRELQETVEKQGSEYKAFKEQLERTNNLLNGRVQDLELYGSGLPVSRNNKPAVPGVTASTQTATEDIAIHAHQPHHDERLSGSDQPRPVKKKKIDLSARKSGPANAVQPPQQRLHAPQPSVPRQTPSLGSKGLEEQVEVGKTSAAVSAALSTEQARKETLLLKMQGPLPKPPVKNSSRRSRRIAGTTPAQLDPPAQIAVPSSSPTTRAPGGGRKRDFNGVIKLRNPTVIVPESPVQSGIMSPFRQQESGFGQRTPTQLFQELQAVQDTSQQPRQALSPVKITDVRLNAPEKENLPPTGAKVVNDIVEDEYTKVHVDPRDPTRIKRRRQIPNR
ncbi:hypothetical protein MBLNU457_1376t1 [Dothideomycetes sp. NU457]